MTFRSILKLLLAIHVPAGLLAGYWDMRLSDAYLYYGQMASVHYYRTLQAHLIAGIIAAVLLSAFYARKQTDRQRMIVSQLALAVSALLFVIFGIKLHLVWLQTHLLDPDGLLWTAALIAGAVAASFLVRYVAKRIAARSNARRIAAMVFMACALFTLFDVWLRNRDSASNTPDGPNVLLIVADTLRYDHVSAYGYPRATTPKIDQLAREGALYEQAFSSSPWTTPSHASLFTGQYPSRNGVDGRNIFLDPASDTLAAILTRNQYQTAGFMNNVYIRRQTGLSRGFQQYEEFWGRNEGSSIMLAIELLRDRMKPRIDTGAAETNESVENWLKFDWSQRSPFFLFVHYMEPHAPYGAPDVYMNQFLSKGVTAEEARKVNQDAEKYICSKLAMTEKDFEIIKGMYDGDIRYMDEQIGALLETLQKKDLMDKTIVIFTADHGEHFGDHQLMSHELSIYDALIRVPLIVRYPKMIPAGTRVADVVQTIDLFPSILHAANINPSGIDLQGSSLWPSRVNASYIFAEYNNQRAVDKIQKRFPDAVSPVWRAKTLRAVRSKDAKLILGSDGTRELYDMQSDPGETNNLIEQNPEQAKSLAEILSKWVASFKPSQFYKKEEISKEAQEELRALGYTQ